MLTKQTLERKVAYLVRSRAAYKGIVTRQSKQLDFWLTALIAERGNKERLRRVVNQLPKTKDGFYKAPGTCSVVYKRIRGCILEGTVQYESIRGYFVMFTGTTSSKFSCTFAVHECYAEKQNAIKEEIVGNNQKE